MNTFRRNLPAYQKNCKLLSPAYIPYTVNPDYISSPVSQVLCALGNLYCGLINPSTTLVFPVCLFNWVGINLHKALPLQIHGGITHLDQSFEVDCYSHFKDVETESQGGREPALCLGKILGLQKTH